MPLAVERHQRTHLTTQPPTPIADFPQDVLAGELPPHRRDAQTDRKQSRHDVCHLLHATAL